MARKKYLNKPINILTANSKYDALLLKQMLIDGGITRVWVAPSTYTVKIKRSKHKLADIILKRWRILKTLEDELEEVEA